MPGINGTYQAVGNAERDDLRAPLPCDHRSSYGPNRQGLRLFAKKERFGQLVLVHYRSFSRPATAARRCLIRSGVSPTASTVPLRPPRGQAVA